MRVARTAATTENEDGPISDEAKAKYKADFKRAHRKWRTKEMDWRARFPAELPMPPKNAEGKLPPLDLVTDLMRLNVGPLYSSLIADDPDRATFGYIPLMAGCSEGNIGALMAESFCERGLSVANDVMVDGNTLLSDEELEMIVVLRMNRSFMRYMRRIFKGLSKQQFEQTAITQADL